MGSASRVPQSPCLLAFAAGGDNLTIRISGYLYADVESAHDANALTGTVNLRFGAFGASFRAMFHTWDFAELRELLGALLDDPRGEGRFQTQERQLDLLLRGDGIGGFMVAGKAVDDHALGHTLLFGMTIDRAALAVAIRELDTLLREYPPRDAPPSEVFRSH